MRMPQYMPPSRIEERKRKEEEQQKLRDERIKAITPVMVKSTIPTTVLHIKSVEDQIKPRMVDHEKHLPISRG